jgi:hypothetical protein
VCELFCDSGTVGVEEQTELRAAFAKLLFEIGAGHGGFGHGSLLDAMDISAARVYLKWVKVTK